MIKSIFVLWFVDADSVARDNERFLILILFSGYLFFLTPINYNGDSDYDYLNFSVISFP